MADTYSIYNLGQGGLPAETRQHAFDTFAFSTKHQSAQKSNFSLAPQLGLNFNLSSILGSTDVSNILDNVFKEGNLSTDKSKFMERAVLDYYAQLWNAKLPHNDGDPESYCGFCLDIGGTKGNVYGMWNGRDYLSGKKIVVDDRLVIQGGGAPIEMPRLVYQKPVLDPAQSENAYTPIAFYLEDTHFSFSKAAAMLDIVSFHAEGQDKYPGQCPLTNDGVWPAEVPSYDSGATNIDSLATFVEFFASRGYPILVCFNYGSTFKGAYDDVASACAKLEPILAKYGLLEREVKYDDKGETKVEKRTGYWFHVEGAYGAAFMPYIEMAYDAGKIQEKGPCFDFRLPMVHSMAMSGDKGIGPSVAGGVYMTRTKYQVRASNPVDSIATPDNSDVPRFIRDKLVPDFGKGATSIPSGVILDRTKHQMTPSEPVDYIGTPKDSTSAPHSSEDRTRAPSVPTDVSMTRSTGPDSGDVLRFIQDKLAPDSGKGATSIPGGIIMDRTKHQMTPTEPVDYIGTPDDNTSAPHSSEDQIRAPSVPTDVSMSTRTTGPDDSDVLRFIRDKLVPDSGKGATSIPSGIIMDRTKHQMVPTEQVDYIGTFDTPSASSHNALSPMFLWDMIARQSYEDQIQKALDLEALAAYTESRLRHLQDEVLHKDLYVERIPLALTVQFKRASDELCGKYGLLSADWGGRRYSRVSVTEHVTREKVDALIQDLSREGAFAP